MITRLKWSQVIDDPSLLQASTPYVLDIKATDITETIVAMLCNLPKFCKAVSCGWLGSRHQDRVEKVAEQVGVRVIWVPGPYKL